MIDYSLFKIPFETFERVARFGVDLQFNNIGTALVDTKPRDASKPTSV